MFQSLIRHVGRLTFPPFGGVRGMMMPVRLDDPETVPMESWRSLFADLVTMAPVKDGVAYLTIDEAFVETGETHRRPGLHVDGVGPAEPGEWGGSGSCGGGESKPGGWGGGGGGWGGSRSGDGGGHGMLVAADVAGCRGWHQSFDDYPHANGDCLHLRGGLKPEAAVAMGANDVFWCSPLAVHESMPMPKATRRSLVRLSMPSNCPWYEGYTRNPLGVEPTGPIHPARAEFMAYRT